MTGRLIINILSLSGVWSLVQMGDMGLLKVCFQWGQALSIRYTIETFWKQGLFHNDSITFEDCGKEWIRQYW